MITIDDLNAAPVGSRLVRDYGRGVKTIMRKRDDQRWQWRLAGTTDISSASAQSLVGNILCRSTLHHPAPVRVTGRTLADGVTVWSWRCQVCDEQSVFWQSSAFTHDHARLHQHRLSEPTRPHAACVHCGIRLPGDLLDAHYCADHGLIGAS